jgi:hypothetical protein
VNTSTMYGASPQDKIKETVSLRIRRNSFLFLPQRRIFIRNGVALDTFTGYLKTESGFGVVDEIADQAHPGKPCAVTGAAASSLPGPGPGPLRHKYCASAHRMLLFHHLLPSLTHTSKRPPSVPYFANRFR